MRNFAHNNRITHPSSRRWGLVAGCILTFAVVGAAWAQMVPNPTIQNPRRIAEIGDGHLLVTDRGGMIVAVDKKKLVPLWGYQLPLEGAPFGLAVMKQEILVDNHNIKGNKKPKMSIEFQILVGNTRSKNVEVYKITGDITAEMSIEFQYNLGGTPTGELGAIENPIGIAVSQTDNLVFVLDGGAKKIKVFDQNDGFIYDFAPVDSAGAVLSPVSIAVDEQRGEVLVGDYGDPRNPDGLNRATTPARILIYDFLGNWLGQIDGAGYKDRNLIFRRVQGLAASADGRIFAADPLASRILVFNRNDGSLAGTIGEQGAELGQLMLPNDVWVDEARGDVYVVNNRGARSVEVFRRAGR